MEKNQMGEKLKRDTHLLLKKNITASDVGNFLNCELIGSHSQKILRFTSAEKVCDNSLVFLTNGYTLKHTNSTIITTKEEYYKIANKIYSNTYLIVDNPRLEFARTLQEYHSNKKSIIKIDKTAIVDKTAVLQGDIYIGKNVKIQPFVTIGTEGFGFIRDEKGEWVSFPQIGGVIIEDNVEIAVGTNIHRASLFDTIIGKGTKISTHCNIGHNSIIGNHVFIGGKTNLGGKTSIGDYSFIGMLVVTNSGIKIGKNVMIGFASVITKDIPDNVLAYGSPVKIIRERTEIWG